MVENSLKNKGRSGTSTFAKYSIYTTAFLLFVIFVVYFFAVKSIKEIRVEKQVEEVNLMKSELLSKYQMVSKDLFYFSQNELAKSVLIKNNSGDLIQLTSIIKKIASLHKNYDQIRLINNQGDEVIRVNQSDDYSLLNVSPDHLQNKRHRYYYKKTSTLQPGDIYISKFDLNIEEGEVEDPIKPVIRFSTPIYSEDGELLGIGVINYLGENIINLLSSLNKHKDDEVYLLNEEGYYLNNEQTEKNWLFMHPEKEQHTFYGDHPKLWDKIKKESHGAGFHNNDEYYFARFIMTEFPLHKVISHESLYIVMRVHENTINEENKILHIAITIGFTMIFPMAILLIYKLAIAREAQKKLIQRLNFQAFTDELTGLYNRQAIIDLLTKNIHACSRTNTPLSIGFIDVNNLKETNDRDGHEAGDDLIRGVSEAIEMSIRKSDYAARLGGDEFLIICIGSDKRQAQVTMTRIAESYRELGSKKSKKWSLCFGCTQMLIDSDSAEAMIGRSDKEMYEQKSKFKHQQSSVNLKVNKNTLVDIRTHSMNLASTSNAVQSLDVNGVIIDVSPQWLKLTGYSRSEAIGRHFKDFLDAQSLEQVKQNFPQLKGYGYVNNVQLMIKHKGGKVLSAILNGTSKYNENGDFVRTFCEITPTSEK